ncbi:hypothetical protein Tco_1052022 [Tanacetum coccineum]
MEIKKSTAKAKGKAIMQESEPLKKIKKKEMIHIGHDEELAQKLLHAEEQERYDLEKALELQKQLNEREKIVAKSQARDINWSDLAVLRYHAVQNRSFSIAESMGSKSCFCTMPMDSELEVQRLKRAGQDVVEEPVKKQRTREASRSVKYLIIDWEIYSEDSRKYWKIIRVGGHTKAYHTFDDMLKKFDKDDLDKLWNLVKERFRTTEPTEDKARELWVELKRLFEPDDNDTLWKLQRYMHDLLNWWLYDTCGVHHVSTEKGHDIYMLVEKDYPITKALMTLMLCNKMRVDQYSNMA